MFQQEFTEFAFFIWYHKKQNCKYENKLWKVSLYLIRIVLN